MGERHDAPQGDYAEFWRWTIDRLDVFWEEIIEYAGVVWERGDGPVRDGDTMPDVRWFPGARINYAENLLRWSHERGDEPAIIGRHEDDRREVLTWNEVRGQVGAFAARLRDWGVGPGDTVCAVLPNLPQTVVALLATATVGAVWSVVNTDFGQQGVAERFAQIEPTVLVTADSVLFNGKTIDLLPSVDELLDVLPTVTHHVLIDQAPVEQESAEQESAEQVPAGDGPAEDASAQHGLLEELRVPSALYSTIVASPQEPEFERVELPTPCGSSTPRARRASPRASSTDTAESWSRRIARTSFSTTRARATSSTRPWPRPGWSGTSSSTR